MSIVSGTEVLDSLGSGVLAVDAEDRILFLNRALARRLHIDRDRWLGRSLAELAVVVRPLLVSPELRQDWPGSPPPNSSRELEFRDEGSLVTVREDVRPMRDAAGEVVGRMFAYHDITVEKEVDRMKSEFIAVASHELRTPMTSIKGSVDLVLSGFAGAISGETQELLEIAQKSCDRLIRLINNILDLSKIESRQIHLELAPMDLRDVAERAMNAVRSLAEPAGVRLHLEVKGALPPVLIDKDRMEQVVTNLLANAIKFSPHNSQVTVEICAEPDWVRCAVCDQGCGIAEPDLERVFGRFQQVGDSRRKGGTGLGLAITRGLVQEHNGSIWVESRLNQGSRFVFRLPAAGTAQAEAAASGK